MPYKLPKSSIDRFLQSLADGEDASIKKFMSSPEFKEKTRLLVESLIEENNQDVARLALLHDRALERVAARGMDIRTIIDVGASDGHWAVMAKKTILARCVLFLY